MDAVNVRRVLCLSWMVTGLLAACGVLLAGCHPGPPARADVPAESQWTASPCDTTFSAPSPGLGGLGTGDRDSVVREMQARRAAWRARGITDYRVRITVRCFCPRSPPAILEVRAGIPVALRDSTGRPAGPPREPYAYTVEGLFDLIERAARDGELREVSYAPCGYPASVGVDPKGLDNWYVITADHLMTPR
jgi:Family of unknown function (DUF6174)